MMRLEARLNIPKQVILAMCVIRPVWEQDGRSRLVDIEKKKILMSSIQYRSRLCIGTLCGGLRATFSDTLCPFLADLVIVIS
jgi:hypothetical protein